ncbi:Na/Pi cotransporter family protein [Rhodoligotrophos defluvii]|uniref:Na/Pi cotransporter family protein n=1 Tax=Rhodoligotrophos defluvii TaxID=2561934 RepID=UPI0010C9927B|nr:Na/Pi cotransporter family protein [Rhodoligotrophos defluvii]
MSGFIGTTVQLIGEIMLMLWGIHMVHSGVLRAFGGELRQVLGRALHNRLAAFGAGLAVTTLLQSSTATGLMATSFAADGLVALVPGLAIMLGANVGTTLIVQVLSFDIALIYPLLIFAGYIAFNHGRSRVRDLGRVGIGLGLILLSLHLMVQSIEPLAQVQGLRHMLAAIESQPMVYVIIAAALTWAAHSSVAIVLIIMSLATAGVIAPAAAIAMVVGANIGSAINPVVEGAGMDPVRLRLPVGNLVNRLVGCAIVIPLLGPISEAMLSLDPEPDRLTANFHTIFNVLLAALFFLPLPLLAKALEWVFPPRPKPLDPWAPQHLDKVALETPSVALANAAREAMRMADVVHDMLRGAQDALHSNERAKVQAVCRMDKILDSLHGAIQRYLTDVSREMLGDAENRRLADILAFSINLEHIGDIIDKNIMEIAAKRIKRGVTLSAEGMAELDDMFARVQNDMKLATAVFLTGDLDAARQLFEEKEHFRELERLANERHFQRVREGRKESIETSGLHLDLVRDIKRIESHIASAAYPILEQHGMLLSSRLSDAGDPSLSTAATTSVHGEP